MNRGEKHFLSEIAGLLWQRGESAYFDYHYGHIVDQLGEQVAQSGGSVYRPLLDYLQPRFFYGWKKTVTGGS